MTRDPPAAPIDLAKHRLQQLYEISRILIGFESVERTLPLVVEVAARSLRLRSVACAVEGGPRPWSMLWAARGRGEAAISRASARASASASYLLGPESGGRMEIATGGPALLDLPDMDDAESGAPRDTGTFITLPLAVGGKSIFGTLQLEGSDAFDVDDLVFANAVVNQLSVAVDRHALLSSRQDALERDRSEAVSRSLTLERQREESARREAAAEAARQLFESLVDNLDQAFLWELDARTLAPVYTSARAEQLLGVRRLSPDDPPESWLDRVHPADRTLVKQFLADVLHVGKSVTCEHRAIDAAGRVLWLHAGAHLAGGDGTTRIQGVSVDVTPLKEAESEARGHLDFTRAIAGSVGEGILASDLTGRVTFMNPAAEELLGWAPGSGAGQRCEDVVRILDAGGVPWTEEHPLSRAIRTGGTERAAGPYFSRRNGSSFAAGYTCAPFRRAGQISGGVIVFRDTTQEMRLETEQRLLASVSAALASSLDEGSSLVAMARLLVPELADGCLVDEVTPDGSAARVATAFADSIAPTIAERTQAFAPRPGWRTPQAIALAEEHPILISNLSPEDLDEIAHDADHAAVMRDVGITSMIAVPLRFRGKALGALTLLMAASGRRFGPADLPVFEEIGRRASMAIENANLYRVAMKAAHAREQILAAVAHDLRNPLGTILASVELFDKIVPSGEVRIRGTADRIRRSAQSMDRLIGDLLDLASIDAGGLSIRKQRNEASAVVSDAVAEMQGRAVEAAVDLTAGPTGASEIWCDHDRIVQAISNLVRNAIAATPRGGAVEVRAVSVEGETVFSVADTGAGISADQIPRLFDKRREPAAGRYGNLGLGLGIVQGIVKAHDGRLHVESVLGQGSTFSFSLPARA